MDRMLEAIDDALLGLAQRTSDATHETLGIDHWSIAAGLLHAGLVGVLAAAVMSLDADGWISAETPGAAVTTLIWLFVHRSHTARLRRQRGSRDAGRALRVSERRLRTVDLLVAAVIVCVQTADWDASSAVFCLGVSLFHLHYYFKAADLPPPALSGRMAWG
jgi:hypothetical protein